MKKLMVLTLALMMTFSLTACGGKNDPAPASTAAPAAAPAPTSSEAPANSVASETDTEELVYTLDYETISAWVDAGYIGTDESGSPVVMAIDAANETAIIIFGDNSDMTAASFVGAITYSDTTGTITDEANESTLTFGVTQVSEDTIELDMGDLGKATIKAASKEDVLEAIKNAIDNYEHIA